MGSGQGSFAKDPGSSPSIKDNFEAETQFVSGNPLANAAWAPKPEERIYPLIIIVYGIYYMIFPFSDGALAILGSSEKIR